MEKPGSVMECPGREERRNKCLRTHTREAMEGRTAPELRLYVPSACSIVP